MITSLDVGNRNGPLEAKVVEELFVRLSKIVVVLVRGQEIRTTLEHPFWVLRKGWTEAWKLKPDDLLISADGQYVPVSGLRHTEDWETVYNLRVADFHTYFVGCDEWNFSVWAHNACYVVKVGKNDGVIRLFERGKEGGQPLVSAKNAAEFEKRVHELHVEQGVKTPDLANVRIAAEAEGIALRKAASELDVRVPGSKEWKQAVEAIRNPNGNTRDFRVKDYRDAERLLNEARGNMPFYDEVTLPSGGTIRTPGIDTYQRGFESHGKEMGNTPWNNQKHIKWKDFADPNKSLRGDGHIYFGE